MSGIGRNMPCPCMSGKKYKVCCMEIQPLLDEFSINKIDENYLFKDILYDGTFLKFLKNERVKVKGHIIWGSEEALTSKARCFTVNGETENLYVIKFRKTPIEIKDVFIPAHELQHVLCNEQGFPGIQLNEKFIGNVAYETLASVIANSIADPIVNKKILKNYDFDFTSYYMEQLNTQIPMIKQFPANELRNEGKIFLISLYVEKMLDWEHVKTNEGNEFLFTFNNRYPFLINEANNTLDTIKEVGFDTPDKVTYIYNYLIDKYNLRNVFKI
jgi:hypothetical protein